MANFLLDTSVLIDLSRGLERSAGLVQSLLENGHQVGICQVVIAEFCSGVPPAQLAEAQGLVEALHDWAISREIAIRAGALRYRLARHGTAISTPDALIAATALSIDATLMTENRKHFPIAGLRLLSARAA